jgi:hypothetical protein
MKNFLLLAAMILMIEASRAQSFSARSSLPYIQDVSIVANCVTKHPEFLKEVAAQARFDFTKDSPKMVAEKIGQGTPVILSTYKKSFTKSIAYRNVGDNVLYFNTTKNPRAMRFMVNTAVHEFSHVIGYGHGSNSSKGKDLSVPYKLGQIAENYADRCNSTKTK